MVVSLAMIAWRGDRLRSPGVIDSPALPGGRLPRQQRVVHGVRVRRVAGHGVPAARRGPADRRTVVGAPYFDRLSMPIGIALLFLMAVAPVLPWRKASTELLRDRLFWPAWCGAAALGSRRRRRRRWLGAARRVRSRRVRRRRSAAPGRARHPPAGLARPRGAGQRRHDRAPRRDHDRHRPGGVEQLHARRRRSRYRSASRARLGRSHVRVGAVTQEVDDRGQRRARRGAPRRRQDLRAGDHQVPPARNRHRRRRACGPGSPTTST